jgi:hypothetical protein
MAVFVSIEDWQLAMAKVSQDMRKEAGISINKIRTVGLLAAVVAPIAREHGGEKAALGY